MDPTINHALAITSGRDANPEPDEALGAVLVQNHLLTPEQLESARVYARDHRCDLRQAIIELNLISAERLSALAFERLTALARTDGPVAAEAPPGSMPPLLPNRIELERDIRAELKRIAEFAPASELLDQIVDRALACRATDIHFDALADRYRVRFRIDGQLHEVLEASTSIAGALLSRIKVVANLRHVERRHPQDGQWSVVHAGRPHTLRVSTLPTDFGERIVLRLHEALNMALGFHQLGLFPAQIELLRRLVSRSYGAVLVGGPVGAGKTTTLYSCLQHVNSPGLNLMTIEDPIEYRVPGVNQVAVDTNIGFSFSEGLRAILRQDPNILMIGEIRDHETAQIGVRAALTGVLVFSTLHAADAASTIGNLFNFGIPGYVLSNALQGVISQRLVRRICPYCRFHYEASPADLAILGLDSTQHDGLKLARGHGCPACFRTGYLGRTGVFEVMEISPLLREMILTQTTREVLLEIARDEGMMTMKQCAVERVLEGMTTVEELLRISI